MSVVYTALVHHPVRDRTGETVTTALTNLDVHDLARSARTYGLAGFFVVTPVEAQRRIAEAILAHWSTGAGRERVPERTEALALCRPVASIGEACDGIARELGRAPRRIATAARPPPGRTPTSFADGRRLIADPVVPSLILFGTGHGLAREVLDWAEVLLEPIQPGVYNHLSVRAAAAIVLDRLLGDR